MFSALLLSVSFLSCKKKENVENPDAAIEELEEEPEEESFYSPAEDDASWVESLLARVEEERIAEELAKMEESLSEYQLDEETDPQALTENPEEVEEPAETETEAENPEEEKPEEKDPIEIFFEEAREGKIISGKNSRMHFFEFDNEVLSPQPNQEGYTLVYSSDGNVTRNYYDFEYTLLKKEEWRIRSASDAKKIRTEEFTYSPETKRVIKKDITGENFFETVTYNGSQSPLTAKKYIIKDEKRYPEMERSWKYDDQNRIISDSKKEYHYKDRDYTKKAEVFSRHYDYSYNDKQKTGSANGDDKKDKKDEIKPDFKYYENNILKMQNKYTETKGTYFSWIYFDKNLSVKTYYENDIRVKDEYYNKGLLFRTKVYEQAEEKKNEERTVIRQDSSLSKKLSLDQGQEEKK